MKKLKIISDYLTRKEIDKDKWNPKSKNLKSIIDHLITKTERKSSHKTKPENKNSGDTTINHKVQFMKRKNDYPLKYK